MRCEICGKQMSDVDQALGRICSECLTEIVRSGLERRSPDLALAWLEQESATIAEMMMEGGEDSARLH